MYLIQLILTRSTSNPNNPQNGAFPIYRLLKISLLVFALLLGMSHQACYSQEAQKIQVSQDTTITVKVDSSRWQSKPEVLQDTSKLAQDTLKVTKKVFPLWTSPWNMTREDIDKLIYEDLGDVVQYLPGIVVKDLGSTGQILLAGLRGASPRQTTVLLDGLPLNEPQSGWTDLNIIPVENIQQVELLTGVLAPLYSNIGGTINIVTQDYDKDKPYSKVTYRKGYYGYSDVDVIFGQKLSPGMKILLGGILKNFTGSTADHTYEGQKIRCKWQYKFRDNWTALYYLLYNKSDVDTPGPLQSDGQTATPQAHKKDIRYDHTITVSGIPFGKNSGRVRMSFYYRTLSRELKDPPNAISLIHRNKRVGTQFQWRVPLKYQTFTLGGNTESHWVNSPEVGKHRPGKAIIYLQDDLVLSRKLSLRVFSGLSWYRHFKSRWYSGAGMIFQSTSFKFWASYNQTQRYPTFNELYATTFIKGNSQLKPEYGRNLELSCNYSINHLLNVTAGIYWQRVEDFIGWGTDSVTQKTTPVNQGQVTLQGLNMQCYLNPWKSLVGGFNVSLIQSKDDQGNKLPDVPEATAYGFIEYIRDLFQGQLKVRVRFTGRFIGDRPSINTHPYHFSPIYVRLPDVGIFDFKSTFDFGNVKLFFSVENILNKNYQLVYGYPMPERLLHWGISWEFWD